MAFALVRAAVRAALDLGRFRSEWWILLSSRWMSTSRSLSSSFFTSRASSEMSSSDAW